MPIIYLKHPTHGVKIATMDAEAEYDEKNGWIRYNPDAPVTESDDTPVVNAMEVRRRGRRPTVTSMEEATPL